MPDQHDTRREEQRPAAVNVQQAQRERLKAALAACLGEDTEGLEDTVDFFESIFALVEATVEPLPAESAALRDEVSTS